MIAQYYFDGRSPYGKKIDKAYYYCHQSIELGLEKYMLMSEILYDKNLYTDTVRYLRKIYHLKTTTGMIYN